MNATDEAKTKSKCRRCGNPFTPETWTGELWGQEVNFTEKACPQCRQDKPLMKKPTMNTEAYIDIEHDPDTYREMSRPFASAEESREAVNLFFEDVKAARERHRIAEVALVAAAYTEPDGRLSGVVRMGDSALSEALFATGIGFIRKEREEAIAELMKG